MYTYLIPHFSKQSYYYIYILYNLYIGVKNMCVKIYVFQQLTSQIALTLILSFLF